MFLSMEYSLYVWFSFCEHFVCFFPGKQCDALTLCGVCLDKHAFFYVLDRHASIKAIETRSITDDQQ